MPPKRLPSYRAVQDWVLFNFAVIEDQKRAVVEEILQNLGFHWLDDPPTVLSNYSKGQIGSSTYYRTAKTSDAPNNVNCSTFTEWCYAQIGVEIPPLAAAQFYKGEQFWDVNTLKVGDLIFKKGERAYWEYRDPKLKIAHVGMVRDVKNGGGAVIHATAMEKGVVEVPINEFIKKNNAYAAMCRIVPDLERWVIMNIPLAFLSRVRESDDIKWVIFEHLKSPGGP